MGNNKSQLVVAAIENGTVIDHIPAEKTYQVVNLLQLEKMDTPVTIGYNLPSKKIGKKGIIKVSKSGKIKALKKGVVTLYTIAVNGVWKKTVITVK